MEAKRDLENELKNCDERTSRKLVLPTTTTSTWCGDICVEDNEGCRLKKGMFHFLSVPRIAMISCGIIKTISNIIFLIAW